MTWIVDLFYVVAPLVGLIGGAYWLTGEDSKRRHRAWWAARPGLDDPCAHLRRR